VPAQPPGLAYLWGEDSYGLERAAKDYRAELEAAGGQALDVWRTNGDDDDPASTAGDGPSRRRTRLLDEVEQRLTTASLFGAGTLVVVRQPGSLLRETVARDRLVGILAAVAPGNALCFLDLVGSGSRGPAGGGALRDAVAAAGGRVAEYPALSRERMEGWLLSRARELGVELGPGAARLLTERVGAYVREGDVDRRGQSELANAELEKLALYRPAGTIAREDVAELVSEAIPGSTWAMLDAVAARRAREAAALLERLLAQQTPLPVLIAQLHRRLRELVIVREHLDSGTRPPDLVRALKVQPFRAQKLAEQARAWQPAELEAALHGLLDLDLLSKGIAPDGSPRSLSEDRSRLALIAWVAGCAPRAPSGSSVRA
jgi:DNA polymerase III delta subunit